MEQLEEKFRSNLGDDLEVMRPEHFILPACILLGGLTAASITFLCEILYSRKYRGKNAPDIKNHEVNHSKKEII